MENNSNLFNVNIEHINDGERLAEILKVNEENDERSGEKSRKKVTQKVTVNKMKRNSVKIYFNILTNINFETLII